MSRWRDVLSGVGLLVVYAVSSALFVWWGYSWPHALVSAATPLLGVSAYALWARRDARRQAEEFE